MARMRSSDPNAWKKSRSALSEGMVRQIRQHADDGTMTTKELSSMAGITQESVRRIVRRESWQWVTEAPKIPTKGALDAMAAKILNGEIEPIYKGEVAGNPDLVPEKDWTETEREYHDRYGMTVRYSNRVREGAGDVKREVPMAYPDEEKGK